MFLFASLQHRFLKAHEYAERPRRDIEGSEAPTQNSFFIMPVLLQTTAWHVAGLASLAVKVLSRSTFLVGSLNVCQLGQAGFLSPRVAPSS